MKWRFGLIGKTLHHSFSPQYFALKFQQLELPHEYEKLELNQLEGLRDKIKNLNWNGFNVTNPFKEEIIPYLDELTPAAASIGAVNCVVIQNNHWLGHNTDLAGFEKSILPFLENHYPRALIIGTGGAAKAIAHVLQSKGIEVFYLSRNASSQNQLSRQDIDAQSMIHFPLIVHCTPLGTWPNIDTCPDIPYEGLSSSHYLFDLVYNPHETLFLKKGLERGSQVQNGLRMLEIQADLSWEFWKQKLT